MARTPVLLLAALGVAMAAGLAWSAAPPRLSFAVAVPPSAPDGFNGYGDAETLAVGDLNGDGRLDLALGSAQDRAVWIVFGTRSGLAVQRTEYPVDGGPSAIAVGDLNGDGSPDLVVARSAAPPGGGPLHRGPRHLAPQVGYATAASPVSVALADLNGDGRL